jgi:hypothetical protein
MRGDAWSAWGRVERVGARVAREGAWGRVTAREGAWGAWGAWDAWENFERRVRERENSD